MTAMSPRHPAPKLKSDSGDRPRQTQSVYQRVATGRGYTVRAGKATRARLAAGRVEASGCWCACHRCMNLGLHCGNTGSNCYM